MAINPNSPNAPWVTAPVLDVDVPAATGDAGDANMSLEAMELEAQNQSIVRKTGNSEKKLMGKVDDVDLANNTPQAVLDAQPDNAQAPQASKLDDPSHGQDTTSTGQTTAQKLQAFSAQPPVQGLESVSEPLQSDAMAQLRLARLNQRG